MEHQCIVSNKFFNINELYLIIYNNNKTKLVCHKKNKDKLINFIKILLGDQIYNFNINKLNFIKMDKQYYSDFNQKNYKKFLSSYNLSKLDNNIQKNNIYYKDKVFYRLSLQICDWF